MHEYYATKSSLTLLKLSIQPGGHLLVGWLLNTISFTTSLQNLCVMLEDEIPQPEIILVMEHVQSLLNNCTESLKTWNLVAKIRSDDFSRVPKGNATRF